MKKYILLPMMAFGVLNSNAQIIEAVDSIDVETGVVYPANEVVDTVRVDSMGNVFRSSDST